MKTVVFETLWANPSDGWAIAARAYARAMLAAGWDVRLKSPVMIFSDHLTDEVKKFLPLERPTSSWDAYIFSSPLFAPEAMTHIFPVLERGPRPCMLYTMFERADVQPELAASIARLDGCFVPCRKNLQRLKDACEASEHFAPLSWASIPVPYFHDDPHLSFSRPRSEPQVFAWCGRWEPRKAPDRLIRAFMRAFKPSESKLIMKLGPIPWKKSAFPSPVEVLRAELDSVDSQRNGWTAQNWQESIRFVIGEISLEAMLALEAETDVYVSPSRGEGIDLPAFRARLAGRRLVLTESGGPEDFADPDDVIVRATAIDSAPEYESIWGNGCRLIDYPFSDLVGALVEARSRPIKKRELPVEHSGASVGLKLEEWIEKCITAR